MLPEEIKIEHDKITKTQSFKRFNDIIGYLHLKKEDRDCFIETLIRYFNDEKECWKLLLNKALSSNIDALIFKEKKIKELGFCCVYERGYKSREYEYIISLDVEKIKSVNKKTLLFLFDEVIKENIDNRMKTIYLAKDERYFNGFILAKTIKNHFVLYDNFEKKIMIESDDLNLFLNEVVIFCEEYKEY